MTDSKQELNLQDLLNRMYHNAEKIGEIGIGDQVCADYVRGYIGDEKELLKYIKKLENRAKSQVTKEQIVAVLTNGLSLTPSEEADQILKLIEEGRCQTL